MLLSLVIAAGTLLGSSNGETVVGQQGKVQFQLVSTDPSIANYAKTRHTLKLVAALMENVLDLQQQIVIQVRRIAPCLEENICPGGLAACGRNFVRITDQDNRLVYYPQALVKQVPALLAQTTPEKMSAFDINLHVNWEVPHYFPFDYPTPMLPTQFDFLHIVLHEVTHGLGIDSLFTGFSKIYPSAHEPAFRHNPTRFDQFFYDALTHQRIAPALDAIAPTSTPDRRARFENITAAFKAKGRLIIPSLFGSNVTLDARMETYLGGSPAHFSSDYIGTQDGIMHTYCSPGVGIHDIIYNYPNWHYAPYGPATLDVLATLGYSLKEPDPNRSLQHYYWFRNKTIYGEPFYLP